MTTLNTRILALVAVLVLLPAAAMGSEPDSTVGHDGRRGFSATLTPFSGWLAGVNGTIAGPNSSVDVSLSPVDILENKATEMLISHFRSVMDFVVIDTPPLEVVSDALSIAPLTDGVILVVGSNMVDRQHLTWTKRILSSVQPNLLGVVLNRTTERRRKEYYYYYSRERKRLRHR